MGLPLTATSRSIPSSHSRKRASSTRTALAMRTWVASSRPSPRDWTWPSALGLALTRPRWWCSRAAAPTPRHQATAGDRERSQRPSHRAAGGWFVRRFQELRYGGRAASLAFGAAPGTRSHDDELGRASASAASGVAQRASQRKQFVYSV